MHTYEFAHGMELFSPIESCMFAMNQHACRRHAENFHIRLTLEMASGFDGRQADDPARTARELATVSAKLLDLGVPYLWTTPGICCAEK